MKTVFSYGGGLDSFALLLEGLRRGERPDVVCFMDVADAEHADPGEWAGTYRHLAEVVRPLCAEHGIEFEWLDTTRYPVRDARSLFAWLEARKQIPTAKGRVCTTIAKVERFERWLGDRFPGEVVEVWIGFEAGEEGRADKDPNASKSGSRRNRFPLIEWGLCRCRCEALVRASGYPVPRKSACTFCFAATKGDFQTLAAEDPATFARIVALEANKPPTKKDGAKLSIKNFRTVKRPDGTKVYLPTLLPQYVAGKPYKRKVEPCTVCGAPEKATKATGCGYLDDNDREVAA